MKICKTQSYNASRHKSIKEKSNVLGIEIKTASGCVNVSNQAPNQYGDQLDLK